MNNKEKLIRLPNRFPVQDVDELRLITGKGDYDYAILLGKDSPADGKAREYYWNTTSTDPDDGDKVIRPHDINVVTQGRWLIVSRAQNISRTFIGELYGNSTQITWELSHNYGTRDMIVQVVQVGQTGSTFNWIVETEVELHDDSIKITFRQKVPGAGEHYKVLATEVITT